MNRKLKPSQSGENFHPLLPHLVQAFQSSLPSLRRRIIPSRRRSDPRPSTPTLHLVDIDPTTGTAVLRWIARASDITSALTLRRQNSRIDRPSGIAEAEIAVLYAHPGKALGEAERRARFDGKGRGRRRGGAALVGC